MQEAIYNPHNKPVDELPFIYGFNNGVGFGGVIGQLISADGMGLGSHACSHAGYIPQDLGIWEGTRPDRHEQFKEYYPDGYRMALVPEGEEHTHPGLLEALRLNRILAEKAKTNAR